MMTANVLTFGLNHHTAPITLRERFAFSELQIPQALASLRARFSHRVQEAAILSTCNRTEIYCAAPPDSLTELTTWLADYFQVPYEEVRPYLYQYQENDAIRHAFRVASGLDSMVLGEPQILGQIKTALRTAEKQGSIGTLLHQLFQRTFATAKAVRSQTAIGKESVSMAAAAVRLAQQVFGQLENSEVLCIGAGEMIELCTTHFAAHGPKSITIANRTVARAEQLAAQFNAHTLTLSMLPEQLDRFDVIISCTASTLPILGLGLVENTIQKRRYRPIVMIDLAVPRDIEPEVARLNDVYLYTVDDLGQVIQQSQQLRKAAVVQAEAIIETRVQSFAHWMSSRQLVPTILRIQEAAHQIQQTELERAKKALARGEPMEDILERLAKGISQKHLHIPLSHLHQAPQDERQKLLAVIDQLFPQHPIV